MIRHIEPSEHIRMRPQMYFKTVFEEKSLDSLPLEIVHYAIDQQCTAVKISLHTTHFSIEFDKGIALKTRRFYDGDLTEAEVLLLKISKDFKPWKNKELDIGEMAGLIRINAVSRWCKLITYFNGERGEFFCKEGQIETRTITKDETIQEYTQFSLELDTTIFPEFTINPITLQEKVEAIQHEITTVDIQLEIIT